MTMPLLTAGADEAGRGPLAGPVVAGAVILAPTKPIPGLADSKTLSPDEREELAIQIRTDALAWAVARADVGEIDGINILHASMLAMRRALLALQPAPELALVDGESYKTIDYEKLVGVLVEAVKELKAEIDELKGNQ